MKPTGIEDPVKTIVTSMAAVLTTSMTLRIILNIRGSLDYGGSFSPTASSVGTSSTASTARGGAVRSNIHNPTNHTLSLHQLSVAGHPAHTYTLDEMRNGSKPEPEWNDPDAKVDVKGLNVGDITPTPQESEQTAEGVKITIAKEVGYDNAYGRK
ncbi:hypothetical protein ONZ45_g19360 [Pleurotus djamor]|nr:hypothetical protein ONZ45_g19360 [Pleurotus djamor]